MVAPGCGGVRHRNLPVDAAARPAPAVACVCCHPHINKAGTHDGTIDDIASQHPRMAVARQQGADVADPLSHPHDPEASRFHLFFVGEIQCLLLNAQIAGVGIRTRAAQKGTKYPAVAGIQKEHNAA